jgi:hypothetical protein
MQLPKSASQNANLSSTKFIAVVVVPPMPFPSGEEVIRRKGTADCANDSDGKMNKRPIRVRYNAFIMGILLIGLALDARCDRIVKSSGWRTFECPDSALLFGVPKWEGEKAEEG